MFDLEIKISEWKSMITESSSLTNTDVVELESHLRDSFAELITKGLNEDEAFMIAFHRLGTPEKLSKEYRKVNGINIWRRRVLWLVLGWLGGNALGSGIHGLGAIAGAATAWAGLGATATGTVLMMVTLAGWGIAFYVLWRSGQKAKIVMTNRSVSTVLLVSLIATLAFGHVLSLVGTSVYIAKLPVEQFREIAYWIGIGGVGIYACVVAICAAIIISLRRTQFEDGEVITP